MKTRRKAITFLVVAGAIYVGSYAANSLCGGYWLKPERDGKDKWSFGLSMFTAIIWQPRFGYSAKFSSDFIGNFYRPLAYLDQKWIHPTRYISSEEDMAWFYDGMKESDVHPHFRDEYRKSKTPNQALQTTTRTVTPAASHPSRQRMSCLI